MSAGPRVWRASADELDTVTALIAEFRDWFGKDQPAADGMRASVERIHTSAEGEYLLGAGEDGEPAGLSQLRYRWSVWTSAEDCWLEDLYVRESARGKGLGRALVEASAERARERGCKRIELDVNEDNAPALALYEACGFTVHPKGPTRALFLGRKL